MGGVTPWRYCYSPTEGGSSGSTPRDRYPVADEKHPSSSSTDAEWKAWKARLEEEMEALQLRREERRAMRAEFAAIRKAGLERRHKAKLERNR